MYDEANTIDVDKATLEQLEEIAQRQNVDLRNYQV